jgi:hypothetical protein
MKKIIYNISTIVTLSLVTLISCTPKDEKLDFLSVGGNVILTDTKISRLDINNDVKFKVITKEGVTTNSISVFKNIATATTNPVILDAKLSDIQNTNGIATLNTSLLQTLPQFASNLTSATSNLRLAIQTNYSDGTTTTNPYTLAIARGINWRVLNSDGVEVDDLRTSDLSTSAVYLDGTLGENILKYKTYKKYSTTVINSVTVEWKKNSTGTYAPVTGTFPTTTGTIDLGSIPYSTYGLSVGDNLFYKVTVTSGTHTDIITAQVLIKP